MQVILIVLQSESIIINQFINLVLKTFWIIKVTFFRKKVSLKISSSNIANIYLSYKNFV